MRLTAQARIFLPGEEVFRDPGLFDKISHFLGGDVDLRTGELALTVSALALTEQIREALRSAGIHNAVCLVVDDDVVFTDKFGTEDDADLLVKAMRNAAGRFERGFEKLRAVFEHSTSGIDTLLEVAIERTHRKEDPSATFALGARIEALRPQADEPIEGARDRIGQLLSDKNLPVRARAALTALVQDIERGCLAAFPRGIVEADEAQVSMRKPSTDDVRYLQVQGWLEGNRRPQLLPDPSWSNTSSIFYDPWLTYYADPIDTWGTLHVMRAMTDPDPAWGYKPGSLGDKWHSVGVDLPVLTAQGHVLVNGRNVGDQGAKDYFSGASEVANLDFSTGQWDDDALDLYDKGEIKHNPSWDCSTSSSSASSGNSSSSWDCSSDCSWDCSSDCSWDCSSDCSWDCSSDCSDWD